MNYDGLTVFWRKHAALMQLFKAQITTFNADETVSNILNPEKTPILSGELQSYPNVRTVMSLAPTYFTETPLHAFSLSNIIGA